MFISVYLSIYVTKVLFFILLLNHVLRHHCSLLLVLQKFVIDNHNSWQYTTDTIIIVNAVKNVFEESAVILAKIMITIINVCKNIVIEFYCPLADPVRHSIHYPQV